MQESNSTAASTPRGLCPAGYVAHPALQRKPNCEGTERFRLRSGLRPLLRAQPSEPCLQCQPVLGNASPSVVWQPRGGLPSQGADKCRVHCQLRSLEEEKSVHHDLEPSCIELVHHPKIQVSDEDVGSHPPTCLSTDSCSRILLSVPTSQQQHTPTDDGQGRREDGHIGKHWLKEGAGVASDEGTRPGEVAVPDERCD